MSRSDFDDAVAHAKLHFEEGLIRAGFREDGAAWCGPVRRGDGTVEVGVSIGRGFPFEPPKVNPKDPEAAPWSWHRELDGGLCLIAEDDHDELWWREPAAFLEHVGAWLADADEGWPNDRPDLDLERYFQQSSDRRLYLLPDLEPLTDSYVRFIQGSNGTMGFKSRMEKPVPAVKKFKLDRFGYVATVRSLKVPPRTWEDIVSMADARVDLGRAVRQGKVDFLILRFERDGQPGAIVLEVGKDANGGIELRRLLSAGSDARARLIRSGPHAARLAEMRVAIVGVGAIGSYVADLLVRAGLRQLTLLDDDILKPGNVVRHLLDSTAVGLRKVDAVAAELVRRYGIEADDIHRRGDLVLSDQTAYEVLASHDLVINATAEFQVTALLHAAAQADGRNFLSVVLQNNGETLRVDVLPPLGGESLPRSDDALADRPANFEAGCGSPVSPTPPFTVVEAAAVATRHAVGILVGEPLHPAGEVRHLSRRDDR